MTERKSFKLYFDRCEPIAGRLSDERLGKWFRGVLEYLQTGALPETEDEGIGMAFDSVKPSLDYDTEQYLLQREKASEAGKKSHAGKPGENGLPKEVNSPYCAPTIGDIKAYCLERGNSIDPQKFFDYYTSNGWMVGKNPMADWKAAIRNWERSGYNDAPKREKDFSDLWREMQDNEDTEYQSPFVSLSPRPER